MNTWKRKCPSCDKELIYRNERSFNYAIKKNFNCASCSAKNRPIRSIELNKKIALSHTKKENLDILNKHPNLQKQCPNCDKTIIYKNKITLLESVKNNTLCNSCIQRRDVNTGKRKSWNKGKKLSNDFCDKIKKSWEASKNKRCGKNHPYFGKPGPMTGKKHSIESRLKMRQRILELYDKNKFLPSYNKQFCEYASKFNLKHNTLIKHAENGGEFKFMGFFADGYIIDKNLWIEYDEPHHYFGGKLRQDDVERQLIMESKLNCKIIRLRECNSYDTFEKLLLEKL